MWGWAAAAGLLEAAGGGAGLACMRALMPFFQILSSASHLHTTTRSTAEAENHRIAYEQFRSVAVWRKGMTVRVPLTALLDAVAPQ